MDNYKVEFTNFAVTDSTFHKVPSGICGLVLFYYCP